MLVLTDPPCCFTLMPSGDTNIPVDGALKSLFANANFRDPPPPPPGFLKGGGGSRLGLPAKKKRRGPDGGPILVPMLKSLHRGTKGGGGPDPLDPPPPDPPLHPLPNPPRPGGILSCLGPPPPPPTQLCLHPCLGRMGQLYDAP